MKKTALITGGSRGIGLGIAKALAQEGYGIAINGVREEAKIKETMDELRSMTERVMYCRGNIGDSEERSKVLDKVKSEFGHLNVLVNNAGVAPKERLDLLKTTEESFERVLKINLYGSFFLSQAVANWMIQSKQKDDSFKAYIVNISSISATFVSVNRGEYCISKAGMGMTTQLFAARLGEYDIPVYEIRPGIVATDMTKKVTEKYDKLIADGLCVQKRWGLPKDVGNAVAALVSGKFQYSTGQIVMIDGGMHIPRL